MVTGGTKGIGRAIADCFADEGADVSVCARNANEVASTVKALQAKSVRAWGRAVDVADAASLRAWIKDSAAELSGIDVLVCNVSALVVRFHGNVGHILPHRHDAHRQFRPGGGAVPGEIRRGLDRPDFQRLRFRNRFRRRFLWCDQGRAEFHYAKGLSRQLVGKNIRVNCVCPGNTYFEGGIWHSIEQNNPALFASTLKVNPTGKFGTAAEVAAGVVFLSSPVAGRISGHLVIDGALTVAV